MKYVSTRSINPAQRASMLSWKLGFSTRRTRRETIFYLLTVAILAARGFSLPAAALITPTTTPYSITKIIPGTDWSSKATPGKTYGLPSSAIQEPNWPALTWAIPQELLDRVIGSFSRRLLLSHVAKVL